MKPGNILILSLSGAAALGGMTYALAQTPVGSPTTVVGKTRCAKQQPCATQVNINTPAGSLVPYATITKVRGNRVTVVVRWCPRGRQCVPLAGSSGGNVG